MPDTKLTITAEARGTSQTADELQKLADAQREVGEAGKQLGEQVEAGQRAQREAMNNGETRARLAEE
jgi:hypothetical protein